MTCKHKLEISIRILTLLFLCVRFLICYLFNFFIVSSNPNILKKSKHFDFFKLNSENIYV